MTTQNKWIMVGLIAITLVVGLTLGAVAVTLIQRVSWGYPPAYASSFAYDNPTIPGPGQDYSYGPGTPMFGRGPRQGGPMEPGFMGRGRFGFGPSMGRGRGYGPTMGLGPRGSGPTSSLVTVAAEQLDMTTADLIAELQTGKTVAEIAQEKDVALDKILDAFLAPHTERLTLLVTNGVMTQAQVDAMLAMMKTNLTARLTGEWSPGGPGWGAGAGPGFGDIDGDGSCDFAGRDPRFGGRGGPMWRWR